MSSYEEHVDLSYNDLFAKALAGGLAWIPWVGKEYAKAKVKVLVVGESYYAGTPADFDYFFCGITAAYAFNAQMQELGIDHESVEGEEVGARSLSRVASVTLEDGYPSCADFHAALQQILQLVHMAQVPAAQRTPSLCASS